MNRREMLTRSVRLALAPLALATQAGAAVAQRPSQPIYRPVRGRPDRPLHPGRFSGGVNYGAAPGTFIVVAVDTRDQVVRLRDEDGRTADVYVSPRLFDLAVLVPGDAVVVDFYVPDDNDDRLEAASIDKLERAPG